MRKLTEARERLIAIENLLCEKYGKKDSLDLIESEMSDFEILAWHAALDSVKVNRMLWSD